MPDGQQTLGNIEPIEIQEEMERSFLDYAMSVIVARALPDVRDGLKPVHRRILYGMWDMGARADRNRPKCAKISGEVMGNYHPHGEGAIYDALVRMAQPFSLRHPLIDFHGNYGSWDDGAAASRYTEAKLAWRSEEHTSELQSLTNLVCRLLLEKKKKHHYSLPFPTKKTKQTSKQE